MCTLVAKKFPGIGWVGVKNRDRPASTRSALLRDWHNDLERVTIQDESTSWSEGCNSAGVCIISSSLDPDDHGQKPHTSANGKRIKNALSYGTVAQAVASLVSDHVSGCVMVYDRDNMWLIEGQAYTGDALVAKPIETDRVVRTNHGIWIPEAGYPKHSKDEKIAMRRLSSEARLAIGEFIADVAQTPAEILTLMAKKWDDNLQLTTLRYPTPSLHIRTTEQLMIVPSEHEILIRNTDGILDFTEKDANPSGSKIHVSIINS
jgi:hypothetical protein